MTWNKLATDIAYSIHQLIQVAQKGQHEELQPKTVAIVESVRLMLYASRSMEKDSQLMQDPVFREPRRAVMSSLSKLVLSSKMGSEVSEFTSSISAMFQKVQRDANDVLVSVRNFVTVCQRSNITINHVNPRLLDDITQLPFEPTSKVPTPAETFANSNKANMGTSADEKKTSTPEANNSLIQKAKFLLNQDLILSLQAYANQIYGSTEELSLVAADILSKFSKEKQTNFEPERFHSVNLFRTLSSQISQYIAILDDINFDNIDFNQIPSVSAYRLSRQSLYAAIGHLFGAIQALTNTHSPITDGVQTIDLAIVGVENALESIEQSIVAMVNERKRVMGLARDEYVALSPTTSAGLLNTAKNSPRASFSDGTVDQSETTTAYTTFSRSQDGTAESDSEYTNEDTLRARSSVRRNTAANTNIYSINNSGGFNPAKAAAELMSRRRQQSIRTDDRSLDSNDTLGNDHHPDDIEYGSDNTVKGGTLAALVERLTVHDTLGNCLSRGENMKYESERELFGIT